MSAINASSSQVESAGDVWRREWAENSGEVTHRLLNFLQGRRRLEITTAEIVRTQTYMHSSVAEKKSLVFVTAQASTCEPNEDDRIRLVERDNFLMMFVRGETLGHSDWCQEIRGIPAAVKRAQEDDAMLFPTKHFSSPELFTWLWDRGNHNG